MLNTQKQLATINTVCASLINNRYFLIICCISILNRLNTTITDISIHYINTILYKSITLDRFNSATNITLMISLLLTPFLVDKLNGMYKVNLIGYIISSAFRILAILTIYIGNDSILLYFLASSSLGISIFQVSQKSLAIAASDYTYKIKGITTYHIMLFFIFLCERISDDIFTTFIGWLIRANKFAENTLVQQHCCINTLNIFLWLPFIINIAIIILLCFLDVEKKQ